MQLVKTCQSLDWFIKYGLTKLGHESARRITVLPELRIVESDLPKEVIKLRNKIIQQMTQSEHEDITIAKKRTLDSEAKSIIMELRRLCPHTFVLSYDGYEGDSYPEWENAKYGERKCATCELTEFSISTREDIENSVNSHVAHFLSPY